jgi:hypothetical protein
MSLYKTIFTRRSVRAYDPSPLLEQQLEDIKQFLAATDRLPGQTGRFEVVTAEAFSGTTAPYAILAYCEEGDAPYANVGYVLQNLDLYLQSIGLGSVWLGMGKETQKSADFCILLAFGKTDVPQRNSDTDFKRLPLEQISNADNPVARAARLAPSAANTQPWKLELSPGKVTVHYVGRGIMKLMLKKMNKVDVGIVTRHVVLALENEGTPVQSISTQADGKKDLAIELFY